MELPIKDTIAEHFRVGDKITFTTPRNGDIKGEIYSKHNSNNETSIQVRLTPAITRIDEAELSRQPYKLDKIERYGSVVIEETPSLSGIQLIYYQSSGKYKEKNDNGLNITTVQFPKIPFTANPIPPVRSRKRGGKKHTKKSNKNRKTNKRKTKYSKYMATNHNSSNGS